jgi:hypothetical protein
MLHIPQSFFEKLIVLSVGVVIYPMLSCLCILIFVSGLVQSGEPSFLV